MRKYQKNTLLYIVFSRPVKFAFSWRCTIALKILFTSKLFWDTLKSPQHHHQGKQVGGGLGRERPTDESDPIILHKLPTLIDWTNPPVHFWSAALLFPDLAFPLFTESVFCVISTPQPPIVKGCSFFNLLCCTLSLQSLGVGLSKLKQIQSKQTPP